ncbi:Asp23/Gls24 family envelope stress response protein [Mycolicibacterium baixiangningiae]|uniref:Asp23/Gls24 family envelope stress response protein n=1 Tax=Mycolicibacterium baixiangningiae TaxID=2761578 RepID=UPI001E33E5DE|nr:Asp23/Gls24 family envelope stress response protein [Mycolicibacterium baixiangningiae]
MADAAPADGGDGHTDAGTLVIKDKVAQRIAMRAALDTPGVAPHAAGIDKLTGRSLPRARVYLSATRVRAHLDLAVTWPHSLPDVGSAVQRNVSEALHDCVGLTVDGVDVAIEAIVTEAPTPARTLL